jgi:uncharacterized protein (TIGR02996 family)
VNEDEAFVRAIVDSPGDDTHRLVYADWLDDRADLRGPYLRAETSWAKSLRTSECPDDRPALRDLAVGLDPVWVARVSRPPVGVCCDHLRFQDTQPRVTVDVLDAVEKKLKLSLPAELRAMLLNLNGGVPKPNGYLAPWNKPDDFPAFIARFFSVSVSTSVEKPTAKHRVKQERQDLEHTTLVLNNGFVSRSNYPAAYQKWKSGVREFVSLAEPAGALGVLAIGLTTRRAGKVYVVNRTLLCTSGPPRLLAGSLSQFLALITKNQRA